MALHKVFRAIGYQISRCGLICDDILCSLDVVCFVTKKGRRSETD